MLVCKDPAATEIYTYGRTLALPHALPIWSGASNQFEAGVFIRSRQGVEHPDLQYHFLPIAMNYDGTNTARTHGFQAHVGPIRPTSPRRVKLGSADRRAHPPILVNYPTTATDRKECLEGPTTTRTIVHRASLAGTKRNTY